MADISKKVSIIVSVDDKTGNLKVIQKNISDLSKSFEDSSKSAEGASNGLGGFVKGIVAGGVALEALNKAVSFTTQFLKDSITEAVNSQAEWTEVATNIANAGIQYEKVGNQIKAVSNEAARLGFTDEEVGLSISKLSLATQDVNKAMEINAIAMDLARYKGVDLETASYALTKAWTGNKMILKQLGIEVDEASNREKTLALVHQQTADAASRFAQTTKGQFLSLSIAVGELKEQIGNSLVPAINYYISGVNGAGAASNVLIGIFKAVASVVVAVTGLCRELGVVISTVLATGINIIRGDWSAIGGTIKQGFKDMKSNGSDAIDTIKNIWSGGLKEISSTAKTNLMSVGDGLSQTAKKVADQVRKEMENFKRDSANMVSDFNANLLDLVIAHRDKTKQLQSDIARENKDYQKLMSDRKKKFDSDNTDLEDRHKEKVASIEGDIADETDAYETALKQQAAFQDDKYLQDAQNAQKKINDLRNDLDTENKEYEKQKNQIKATFDEETKAAEEAHKERLNSLQAELAVEMEIYKKHETDFAALKDKVADDDITRLKKKFEAEQSEMARQHEERLKDLYSQGYSETEAYNQGRNQASSQSVTQAVQNKQNEAINNIKNTKISGASFNLGPSGVSGSSAALNANYSSGGNIFSAIGNAISGAVSWVRNLLNFDEGGVVPGPLNSPTLAVVHGGERVIPNGGASGVNLTVNVGIYAGSHVEKRRLAMELWDEIGQLAKSQNVTPESLLGF